MLYGRAKESIRMLPAAFLQKIAISFLISQISNCILAFYALTMSGALSQQVMSSACLYVIIITSCKTKNTYRRSY